MAECNQGYGYGGKLIALVAMDAFEQPGFEGYVQLKSKINGIEKFYDHLGGERNWQRVIFDTDVSKAIINKYLPDGGTIQWIIN
ncbi:hypothetical protein EQG49_03915 [Periweissella cryptocerci]|uniref:Uncharacterized protein n=1 Tax=Periweissella cryptocerci TaxID=2506420 RepID=A0A4P6YSH7_9LACO|nr:hypothetical protein EQG49_03915 [Periweissella cryptocerci]